MSLEGGYAESGSGSLNAYIQSFANWQVGQPTHYVQHVPGSLWCQSGDANFSISCSTGAWTIGTLLNTTINGVTIPVTSDTVALLGTAETFTKNQSGGLVSLTDTSGVYTFDINSGQNLKFNLVHGETVTISNPTNIAARVGSSGVIEFVQSSTGVDTISTWGTDYKFAGGTAPSLSSAANARDYFSYYIDDSTHMVISGGVLNAH